MHKYTDFADSIENFFCLFLLIATSVNHNVSTKIQQKLWILNPTHETKRNFKITTSPQFY